MIFNYKEFLNESINKLRYSIFDWDDNILMMDTKLHVKKNVNGKWINTLISTEEFAEIRNKYDNYLDNKEYKMDDNTFVEFRDIGPRGNKAFLEDVKIALNNKKYGPSWNNFINCLIDGNLFGIVTTRGHEPESIRMAVEYIIYNELDDKQQDKMLSNLMKYHEKFDKDFDYLVDDYLDNCFFIGITSNYFKKQFGYNPTIDLNKGKQDAIQYIIDNLSKYGKKINTSSKIGFSDDDTGYANAVKNIFINNKELFDDINFYIFDTSDEKNVKKERI